MPLSPETDRKLVDLITDLADCGLTPPLWEVVDDYGPERTSRALRDGFAAVFQATDEEFWTSWQRGDVRHYLDPHWEGYLSSDEAIELTQREPVPRDYRIREAPGSLELKAAPDLIFEYAADRSEAVAEVRARHGLA